MNFESFENSNFFKSAKIRINPLTLEQSIHYLPIFDWRVNECTVKVDPVSYFYIDFHWAVKMSLPKSNTWITEEFRNELYRQLTEVRELMNYALSYCNNNCTKDKKIQILRSRLVISKPGVEVFRHQHSSPMTITFCYKFDDNSISNNETSHLTLGPNDNMVKAYVPNNDKFYFVMKNSPMHGAITNEWRFWWFSDFTDLFDVPELPFPKWENKYLDSINL
jgi:hypothetical protein